MDTDTVEPTYEPKPGFSLVKYGNVFTFNFNTEFAQRLKNVLADFQKNQTLEEPVLGFFKNLSLHLQLPAGEKVKENLYILTKFDYVYSVICERKFAQSLNHIMSSFLVEKRVSPALFSFTKQLEGALYPQRFNAKTRYADEY
jgi:hypothetical protein